MNEPTFDNNTISNVTVQLGGSAFLHCRVRNLGERTVSGEVRIPLFLYLHLSCTFIHPFQTSICGFAKPFTHREKRIS